jgi:rhodanese-related sulfurtransferase
VLILYENGYTKAYVLTGGMQAWELAGYPVESP